MTAALFALTAPELATLVLAVGVPLAITAVLWPLLPKSSGARKQGATSGQPADPNSQGPLGLAGQWSVYANRLAEGIDRQHAALSLHRRAALHIGALDYEIDCVGREARAMSAVPPDTQTIAFAHPLGHTRQWNAPVRLSFPGAIRPRPAAAR